MMVSRGVRLSGWSTNGDVGNVGGVREEIADSLVHPGAWNAGELTDSRRLSRYWKCTG